MIKETPWLDGLSRIWRVPYDQDTAPATIGFWLIHAPWMHLAWSWHVASIVHLRPIDGAKATFQFEEATHEFMVVAIDPNHEPTLDHKSFKFLRPISICQQFLARSDDKAVQTVEIQMENVAKGGLSLDSDYRGAWRRLLLSERRHREINEE
ncbi:hypothetical protein LCGC14_1578220 [marine sediment metagenome]|uniref:Uncharacterized protein n=1 Tax=marine sediment metagenome TaxID=412755 RepID=A0A0F9IHT7_9ZZZZ